MRRWRTRHGGRWSTLLAVVGLTLTLAAGALVPLDGAAGAASVGPVPDPRVRVAFYGDSLGYNAEAELRAAIEPAYAFTYRGAGGAAVEYWRSSILRRAHRPDPPDVLVLELGTADAGWAHRPERFEADVRGVLDEVSPLVPCIRWLDQRQEPSYFKAVNKRAQAYNEILWRVAADYPNVEVVHYSYWASLSNARDVWWPDLLHHNAAGRQELAALVRQAVVGCDPNRSTGPFWDLPDDDPVAPAATWMVDAGLTTGFPNHTFRAVVGGVRPTVTRAQAAGWLWHLAGAPTVPPDHLWVDVPARLERVVAWATSGGVLPGADDGTWSPKAPVTRGDLVEALWRLAGSPTGAPAQAWTDLAPELVPAFDWAASMGLAEPFPDGGARPGGSLTRGKVARLLHAYATGTPVDPPTPTTSTTSTTASTSTSTTVDASVPPSSSTTSSSTAVSAGPPPTTSTPPSSGSRRPATRPTCSASICPPAPT